MSKISQAREKLYSYLNIYREKGESKLPGERELALELGFSRSTVGKALGILEGENLIVRRRQSGTFLNGVKQTPRLYNIGLMMRTSYLCTDPYWRQIVDQTSILAGQKNISLHLFDMAQETFKKADGDNAFFRKIAAGELDGALVVGRMPLSIIGRICTVCPTVLVDNAFWDGEEVVSISCDYFRAGFLAGLYLARQGYRKIAYATNHWDNPKSAVEFSGMRSALEVQGIDFSMANVLETRNNFQVLSRNTVKFFSDFMPEACMVRYPELTRLILSVLRKHEIPLPEKFTLVTIGAEQTSLPDSGPNQVFIDDRLGTVCEMALGCLCAKLSGERSAESGLVLLEPRLYGE